MMISRRDLLKLSGLVGLVRHFLPSLPLTSPDYKLEIAPLILELSPRHRLKTTAYNGQVPGALCASKKINR